MPDLEVADSTPADVYPDRALARQVLEQCDETTRTVAVGVLVDGMEHEEVAELLGISRRTVARKLERFLDTARRYLARS
jgi:RNA polymerase sigma-70 factor (ECF subfamily)